MFSPHEALWDQNIVNRGDSWQHLQEQGLQAASAGTGFAGLSVLFTSVAF
jgi:hypothetical protein